MLKSYMLKSCSTTIVVPVCGHVPGISQASKGIGVQLCKAFFEASPTWAYKLASLPGVSCMHCIPIHPPFLGAACKHTAMHRGSHFNAACLSMGVHYMSHLVTTPSFSRCKASYARVASTFLQEIPCVRTRIT
jgi:hypothetical protein